MFTHFHCAVRDWSCGRSVALFMFSRLWLQGLTVNVNRSAQGGFLQNSSLSSPVAGPCQAHMSHIQLFKECGSTAGAGLGSSVGVKGRLEGRGDVCAQLNRTKPSLCGPRAEDRRRPWAEREEMFKKPSPFIPLIAGCVKIIWYRLTLRDGEAQIWVVGNLGSRFTCFIPVIRTSTTQR